MLRYRMERAGSDDYDMDSNRVEIDRELLK